MNRKADREREVEAARVGRIYAGYQASRRKRRAWAGDNPGNIAIREELLAAVLDEAGPELRSGGEVLDVGCGTGYWLQTLHEAGVQTSVLTGIDVLPDRVATAAARVPGATLREADARALPYEDARFAVVLLFTVLSSLGGMADVRRALSEARRVLRPGGVLICYEPRLTNPLNRQLACVRDADLDAAGIQPRAERRLTLLPGLARRLGRHTYALYPLLARLPPLRTHRLLIYRSQS